MLLSISTFLKIVNKILVDLLFQTLVTPDISKCFLWKQELSIFSGNRIQLYTIPYTARLSEGGGGLCPPHYHLPLIFRPSYGPVLWMPNCYSNQDPASLFHYFKSRNKFTQIESTLKVS